MRANNLNKKSEREGMIIDNGKNGIWLVEEYVNTDKVIVKLMGTEYRVKVSWRQLMDARIKNPFKLNKFGGYLGVDENNKAFDLKNEYIKRAYSLWYNMLERVCTNDLYNNVSICDRWACFANFLEDLQSIKGYYEWASSKQHYEYVLDKDIMQQDTAYKVYSPKGCCFVTLQENLKYQDNNKPVTKG